MQNTKPQAWYRQFWPWFLMFLPMTAVVASGITIWLAIKSADGLVADDYYKQGVAINQTLDRDLAAQALDVSAELTLEGQAVRIQLSGKFTARPESLQLTFAHPTQSGRDQRITLKQGAPGIYSASTTGNLSGGRWHLLLEPSEGDWRLSGIWQAGTQKISLGKAKKSE